MSFSPLPSSSDNGDARSHAKPNLIPPTKSFAASSDSEPKTPRRSSVIKKSRDMSRPDTRVVGSKRSRDRPEGRLPASKKKKNSRKTGASGSKSQIDIEELLAQTYPKEPSLLSILGDETHRSNGLEKPGEPAKNTAKKWSVEDEINLANAVLASSTGGQVNMATLYERAKETLQNESHGQIYDKMRSMRSRFWTIESQLRDAKIAEEFFTYRSTHEADLYKVWKRIWGRHDRRNEASQVIEMEQNRELRSRSSARHNGDVKEGRHESRTEAVHMNGELRSHSHAMQGHNGEVTDDPPEEEEEEHHQAEEEDNDGETADKTPSRVACNHDEEFNLIQNEVKALVCKVKNNVQTMLDDTEAKMEGLIDSLFKRAVVASQVQSLGSETGIGSCLCSSLSRRMKELEGVRSVREFSGLHEAEAKRLQQKWRKHQIEELRTFSGRLELLQEECKLCIKDLETANGSHNS